jgi:hypothetical protein
MSADSRHGVQPYASASSSSTPVESSGPISSVLDVHQTSAVDVHTAFHALCDAYLRRRRLAQRLGFLQSSCRRRSRLVFALDSSHRDALSLYRLLAQVVIKNLRDSKRFGPEEITAVTIHMLADITYHVRQLAAALVEQQNHLSRLRWFGSVLKVKLYRYKQRIRKATRLYERLCG